MKDNHFLSVIMPIYKQEGTIVSDLQTITQTLNQIRYDYELIAVIDGKSEDQSYSLIKKAKIPKVKVFALEINHGKGYAVRFGMAHTKGDYVAFIDAGMEIDPNGISIILEHMEWYNADVIVASKLHPASQVSYPLQRRLLSLAAQLVSRILLGIKVKDTQAGLKIFKRKVLVAVLPRLLVKRFAFDLEILAVANHLGFGRIYEAPLKLNYCFTSLSHATGLRTIFNCAKDALAVFYRLKILHYYDDQNHRHWIYDRDLHMRINTGQ